MPVNKKRVLIIALLTLTAFLAGIMVMGFTREDRADAYRNLEKFSRVYQKIISSHVDQPESDELIDAAIQAMIDQLDPFSQFMDEDMLEDLMVKTKGEFGGLGIIISVRDDYPTVVSPIEGTPADRLGIRGGDKIVEIEGENTEGWKVQDAVDRLRGPKGTPVDIGISRYGVEEILPYHIVRDIIEVESVPYYFVIDDNIGYIRLSNFGEKTREEMIDALEDLQSQGIEGLVLDLRNNPGGLLDSAREVSDLFLDKDRLIVSTRGRNGERMQEIYSDDRFNFAQNYPLVVMINEYSASASEIVAGAIQDWDRGLVVGRNSFGKGSVQSIYNITDREALKLTTAKYYTPSGRCIHKDENNERFAEGDDHPDYELEETADVEEDLDELPLYYTMVKQRPVRGGGGISPDVRIEAEEISEEALDLIRRSAFFNFAVELNAEREVDKDFSVDDAVLQEFHEFLDEQQIEFADEDFAANEDYIRMAILREVFYKRYGDSEAARATLEMDRTLQETLSLLKRNATIESLFAEIEVIEVQEKE